MVRALEPTPWSDEDLAALLADGVLFTAARPSATTPDFWPPRAELPTRDATEPTWDHLMPELESEWAAGRRQQQVLVRLLPRRLQRLINRLRTTLLREGVLDLLTNEVMRRAAQGDRLLETACSTEELAAISPPRSYVPAPDMRRLLREVAAELNASLIVVSAKRHHDFGGLLLGAVADHLLHRPSRPVVVLPHGYDGWPAATQTPQSPQGGSR